MLGTASPSVATYGSTMFHKGQNWQFEEGCGIQGGLEGPLWFHGFVNVTVNQPSEGTHILGPQTADDSELKEAAG